MNRRALHSDDRDLAELVRAATTVAPSDVLLDRVHASRADGLRVMLPSGEAATVPVTPAIASSAIDQLTVEQLARRVWMIGIAVAAAVVAAVTAVWPRPDATETLVAATRALPRQAVPRQAAPSAAMEHRAAWPHVASPLSPDATGRVAAYPGLANLDESRLKPGRRSYLRSVGNLTHALLPLSTYTVELDSAVVDEQRTWRLVTVTQVSTGLAENTERNAQHDTVWVRRSDLRPLRRARHAGLSQLYQSFTDRMLVETDSLVAPSGNMRVDGSTRRLDARRPFVPTEETMRILLRASSLHEGWRASVAIHPGENRRATSAEPEYLNLRVEGVRDVQTLSGRFATWRVVFETGPKPEVWYVSKETGETLLTEGFWGVAYPVSETRLLYGFEETKRLPPVGNR